jgi:hypothetical protein
LLGLGNGDHTFRLLLTDDGGGFIFAARWLAYLVNTAMKAAKERQSCR